MRILFLSNRPVNVGSERLFIRGLCSSLKELGYQVEHNTGPDYGEVDCVIFGKDMPLSAIEEAREHNHLLIGLANPSDLSTTNRNKIANCDFLIAGSLIERDYYLQYCPNVFFLPLVENIFTKTKKHTNKDVITLGYHGNMEHLTQFKPFLAQALEEIAQEIKIKLKVVYNKKDLGEWQDGRPNIDVECVQWDLSSLEDELLECDIGILPNLTTITDNQRNWIFKFLKLINGQKESRLNDYLLRFKNTSNAGRNFVFYQLGIPVVADFTPTNFSILYSPDNGYVAHTVAGWKTAILELAASAKKRQQIADNAKKEFETRFDRATYAQKLYESIENLFKRKHNV